MNQSDNEHPCCLHIRLPLEASYDPRTYMLCFGLELGRETHQMGGDARYLRTADGVVIVLSGVSKDRILPHIDRIRRYRDIDSKSLKVIVEEHEAPKTNFPCQGVTPGRITRQRLTKKFLFGLPDGAILVGNCILSNGRPSFAARLDAGIDRARVWKTAVNSKDDGCVCTVYWDERDVEKFHGYTLESLMDDDDQSPLPMFRLKFAGNS